MTPEIWYAILIVAVLVILLLLYFLLKSRAKNGKKRPVVDPYIQGLNALLEGNLDAAARAFRESARQDTENVDAYLKLGDIFREQKDWERAIKIHRELLVRRNLQPSVQLQILRSLAKDYKAAGQIEKALATIDDILKQTPKDVWATNFKLKLFEEKGDWEQAFRTLRQLEKIDPGHFQTRSMLALYRVEEAKQLFEQKKEKAGRIKLREALKSDPKCVPAFLYLGDSYIREERADDALKAWKTLIETVPEYSHLVLPRLRELLFNLGKFSEIESILTDLLHKNPENLNVYFALSHIYERKGQFDQAIDLCEQILERKPDEPNAKLLLIRLLAQKKDYPQLTREVLTFTEQVIHPQEEFTCSVCGYRSEEPLWHCPRCGQWNTFDLKKFRL